MQLLNLRFQIYTFIKISIVSAISMMKLQTNHHDGLVRVTDRYHNKLTWYTFIHLLLQLLPLGVANGSSASISPHHLYPILSSLLYSLHILVCYIYMNHLCGLPFFLLLSSSIFKIFSPIYPVSLLFLYSYYLILFSYFPSKLLNLSCSFLFISAVHF